MLYMIGVLCVLSYCKLKDDEIVLSNIKTYFLVRLSKQTMLHPKELGHGENI